MDFQANYELVEKRTIVNLFAPMSSPAWVISVTALPAGENSSLHLLLDLLCVASQDGSDIVTEAEHSRSFWFSPSLSREQSRSPSDFWQRWGQIKLSLAELLQIGFDYKMSWQILQDCRYSSVVAIILAGDMKTKVNGNCKEDLNLEMVYLNGWTMAPEWRKGNMHNNRDRDTCYKTIAERKLASSSTTEWLLWWLGISPKHPGIVFFEETRMSFVNLWILLMRAALASSSSSNLDCIFTWPSSNYQMKHQYIVNMSKQIKADFK